jgi:hypothetical protein
MHRAAAAVLICLLVSLLIHSAIAVTNDRTLVRVPAKGRQLLKSLAEQDIEILSVGKDGTIDVVVDSKQLAFLQGLNVPLSVLAAPGMSVAADLDANLGLYHTYAEMQTELNNLVTTYPTLASLGSIGTSIEGRTIYVLKISDNVATDESEPEVLIMSNLHAREIMTVDLTLRFAMYLLNNYGSNPTVANLVNNREVFVLPMLNPDGHVYVEDNHIGIHWSDWWRKNRRDNGDGTFGVDLNRNFGYEWGYDDIGSSPLTSSLLYRGTGPFSEPETQVIRDFCATRQFVVGFSYHSYGELLLFPWAYDYLYTPDHDLFVALGDSLTSTNGYFAGNPAMGAIYTVNGDSDDWAYGDDVTKPPFLLYTPEVNSYEQGGFGPPDTLIQPTFDLLLPMNMALLELADNPRRVLGPNAPTLQPTDHAGLTWPQYRLTWSGPNGSDPNPPTAYEIVEYKNLSTVQDSANAASNLWDFDGFALSTTRAYEGTGSYYSGAIDNTSSRLQAAIFYRVNPATETFSSWVWYNIETHWDYAYLEVSSDGGLTWSSVVGNLTTDVDPNGNNLGNGITGLSSGWVQATFSLSAYLGTEIMLRWNYVTDQSVLEEGIYIDLASPVPAYESRTVLASGLTGTSHVVLPAATGSFTYLVRAQDAENHYSLWSNSRDEQVNTLTGITDTPTFATGLGRNCPNPFNPETTIPYTVGGVLDAPVSLRIYNIAGQRVATLVDREMGPGVYQATWRGRSDDGAEVPSGVYFSRLTIGDLSLSHKLVLLK